MKNELKDIKLLMDAGILAKATVTNSPMFGGWTVDFDGKKKGEGYGLYTQRGELRAFKSLDAACKVIKELGFAEFAVKPQ
ncbi:MULTISPECIES: hypothetical protein [unclassified Vibrio]|uniref:hypothetical protein n=1 Tax=unclassified Vibrio TaxID=2614977 RepID=UPI0035529307